MSVSLEESSSLQSENYPSENDFATEDSSEEPLAQPLSSDEVGLIASFVISFFFSFLLFFFKRNFLFSIERKWVRHKH